MPGPSPEAYDRALREALLGVARDSVRHGLAHGAPLPVDASRFPGAAREPGASFVTLRIRGALRGCTGRLAPERPLVEDVAENAFRSAFADPRFEPVGAAELGELEFHIAVLGTPEPIEAGSESALIEALRPGLDGLILREGDRLATFLPAVWESLPEPRRFVQELKRKAGLPAEYWSAALRFERYAALQIGE